MENSLGLVIGFLAGFLVSLIVFSIIFTINKNKKTVNKNDYLELEKELQEYRQKVADHFSKTADAIDQLSNSYQAVFNQLKAGAKELIDEETLQQIIDSRKVNSINLNYLADQNSNLADNPKNAIKSIIFKANNKKPINAPTRQVFGNSIILYYHN